MIHKLLHQVVERCELAKTDSDAAYFLSLLYLGESIFKTITAVAVSSILDEHDRNRYRLEHSLVRASGIGEWASTLEDAVLGSASQFIIDDARVEQRELTQKVRNDDWRHQVVDELRSVLVILEIDDEVTPQKVNLLRWFRLFALLRNKTRGHGAPSPEKCSSACGPLRHSLDLLIQNYCALQRPCAYLHQNLSGKYRVSPISGDMSAFDRYKSATGAKIENGIYVDLGEHVRIPVIESSAELRDFYFMNGGFTSTKYECISYASGSTLELDSTRYLATPGRLPSSETEGTAKLEILGNCFANVPVSNREYIPREELEAELAALLGKDRHEIITLTGRGGIGKTSLALATINEVAKGKRFEAIIWFSSRDIDLKETGPKPVRPHILNEQDVSEYFTALIDPPEAQEKGFSAIEFFQTALLSSLLGPTLFIFDNFETTSSPVELFTWIDTYIRSPNKVLITTRLHEFKGDYPLVVQGMKKPQSLKLIEQTARALGIEPLLTEEYVESLVTESEGHPYVIKILLGQVAKEKKAVNVRISVAANEDILTALFERSYSGLSEAARRVFLTLASWNSSVPRVALEAVLLRPENETSDVGGAIEALLLSSLVEIDEAVDADDADEQGGVLLTLPLAAREFGRKKLNVSHMKTAVLADSEILQMLGVQQPGREHKIGIESRIKKFVQSVARRVEASPSQFEKYKPVLEMMGRNHFPTWLLLADFYSEVIMDPEEGKECLRRFLESEPSGSRAAHAWKKLADLCHQTGHTLEELHAFIERAQESAISFVEISDIANRFNQALYSGDLVIGREERDIIGNRLLQVMERRLKEAGSNDYSRMAWLALNLQQDAKAAKFVETGLSESPNSDHLLRLKTRLGI